MTNRKKVIEYLRKHPEGIDDDELAVALNLKYRQQANSICRQLEKVGIVRRLVKNGKIHSFFIEKTNINNVLLNSPELKNNEMGDKKWFWEGNVQQRIVDYLNRNGFMIISVANTLNHQRGVDIVSKKEGEELWITVKGYPTGTEKTRASTQASHWFKQAVFDIIDYRQQSEILSLGIGLPDFPRYHSLSEKILWFKNISGFHFYWVDEDGNVTIE